MLKNLLFYLFFLASLPFAFAQKQEVERRIPAKQFPVAAQALLADSFPDAACTKYFLEINEADTTYEAKFKWQRAYFSVEFQPSGSLKDIEKRVKFNGLPASVQVNINRQFDNDFIKYRIKKCQEQTLPGVVRKRYEIELEGRPRTGQTSVFEYLFEEDGSMIQRQKVFLPTNDINLY